MQQRRLEDAFASMQQRYCGSGVDDDEKRLEVRFLQRYLCYSSSIFPSVYKACAVFERVKN
jgi:hypothetical protein